MISPYERITNLAIDVCMSGEMLTWDYPWISNAVPQLRSDGEPYVGVNQFALGWLAKENGYHSRYWPTFEAVVRNGGNVKGIKTNARVWMWYEQKVFKKQLNKTVKEPRLTTKAVWNADVVRWPDEVIPEIYKHEEPVAPEKAMGHAAVIKFWEWADPFIQDRSNGLVIEWKEGGPSYNFRDHIINLPETKWFKSGESCANTSAHEMAHATGHKSLLDRPLTGWGSRDTNYHKEELIAEMTAMLVLNHLGIRVPEDNKVSLAYLQHWGKVFEENSQMFLYAMNDARKAFELIEGERIKCQDTALIAEKG